jgi:hypothetical protein
LMKNRRDSFTCCFCRRLRIKWQIWRNIQA